MSELFEPVDAFDRRLARDASGLLGTFNRAGVLTAADCRVADRVAAITGETDDRVRLAIAVAVQAVRAGSVCADLATIAAIAPELPWPDPQEWCAAVAESPLVERTVLRLEGELLYLDRYWREEVLVCQAVLARRDAPAPPVDENRLPEAAARIFGPGYEEQRAAAVAAAGRWTTLVTGGPGTGKTTAVAGLLALLAEQSGGLRIALAAPTGKAAARLQQAVTEAAARLPAVDRDRIGELSAVTLHRLLGTLPGTRTRFRHHRENRLPDDLVVVDETSMVSLSMMARLLDALRPETRLVLVGDPDQLSSVEAGAVLADLVAGLAQADPGAVVSLRTTHRFGARIGALAAAIRDGDPDLVIELLAGGQEHLSWLDPGDEQALVRLRARLLRGALALREAAARGDREAALAELDRHRLLCAHREGPYGAASWSRQIERWLGESDGVAVGAWWGREWYAGRPVLVTANDYGLGVYNGDSGVVVDLGEGRLRVVLDTAAGPRELAPSRLADVETMHALTIHKSQGGQAEEVTVILPPEDSRLLTRELLYTAVTRARRHVHLVGDEAAIRAAVTRRAQRASGLRARLAH